MQKGPEELKESDLTLTEAEVSMLPSEDQKDVHERAGSKSES